MLLTFLAKFFYRFFFNFKNDFKDYLWYYSYFEKRKLYEPSTKDRKIIFNELKEIFYSKIENNQLIDKEKKKNLIKIKNFNKKYEKEFKHLYFD